MNGYALIEPAEGRLFFSINRVNFIF